MKKNEEKKRIRKTIEFDPDLFMEIEKIRFFDKPQESFGKKVQRLIWERLEFCEIKNKGKIK